MKTIVNSPARRAADMRKANLLAEINLLIYKAQDARDAALKLDSLDVSGFESVHDLLRETENMAGSCWDAFASIYFPKGAEMELHLQSTNRTNLLRLSGPRSRGAEICYYNLKSKRYSGLWINTLLGLGAWVSKADKAVRIENINQQLASLKLPA